MSQFTLRAHSVLWDYQCVSQCDVSLLSLVLILWKIYDRNGRWNFWRKRQSSAPPIFCDHRCYLGRPLRFMIHLALAHPIQAPSLHSLCNENKRLFSISLTFVFPTEKALLGYYVRMQTTKTKSVMVLGSFYDSPPLLVKSLNESIIVSMCEVGRHLAH